MRDCRKSLCLVLVLAAILLASMLPGCGGNDKETTPTPMPTETPAEAPTDTPATLPTEAPTEAPAEPPAEVPEESPPLPGTPISKDKPTIIQSISNIVGEGEVLLLEGAKYGTFKLVINGKLPINESEYCLGCFETIKMGPNLSIPMNLFTEQEYDESPKVLSVITDYGSTGATKAYGQYVMEQLIGGVAFLYFQIETVTTLDGEERTKVKSPPVIEYISFQEAILEILIDAEDAVSIVSGPDGATLKKSGNGFLLLEGEAYLVD